MDFKFLLLLVLTTTSLMACDSFRPSSGASETPAPSGVSTLALETPASNRLPTSPAETRLAGLRKPVQAQVSVPSMTAPPTFSWQTVEGAQQYLVVVAEADPYQLLWFWVGPMTQVKYGDLSVEQDMNELADLAAQAGITSGASLPRVPPLQATKKYVWSVIAYDGEGEPLAASVRQPLPISQTIAIAPSSPTSVAPTATSAEPTASATLAASTGGVPADWQIVQDGKHVCQMAVPPDWTPGQTPGSASDTANAVTVVLIAGTNTTWDAFKASTQLPNTPLTILEDSTTRWRFSAQTTGIVIYGFAKALDKSTVCGVEFNIQHASSPALDAIAQKIFDSVGPAR